MGEKIGANRQKEASHELTFFACFALGALSTVAVASPMVGYGVSAAAGAVVGILLQRSFIGLMVGGGGALLGGVLAIHGIFSYLYDIVQKAM